jgi:hypothetical protein
MGKLLHGVAGVIITAVVVATSAAAQKTDFNAIITRAEELRAAGNYAAALVEAEKLETGVKRQFATNHANYAVALRTLANVYMAQGRYAEARRTTSARWRSVSRSSARTTSAWRVTCTIWPSYTTIRQVRGGGGIL